MTAFPPRNDTVAFAVALNAFYADHGRPSYCAGYPFGGGVDAPLHVDGEGLIVWLQEYLLHRVNGHSDESATLTVFAQIMDVWEPAGAPHPRPVPPAPVTPPATPPVNTQPTTDVPGVLDNMVRFATFYAQRCARLNWFPNHLSTHAQQMEFLRASIIEWRAVSGERKIVMKRASATRPISNEVVVFMADPATGDYRRFWDFIGNAGLPGFVIKQTPGELGHGEILPADQILVDPDSLQNIVG